MGIVAAALRGGLLAPRDIGHAALHPPNDHPHSPASLAAGGGCGALRRRPDPPASGHCPRGGRAPASSGAQRSEVTAHRGSARNVGTVEPPPAVTLTSASVEMRVRHPCMNEPNATYGFVSSIRSMTC